MPKKQTYNNESITSLKGAERVRKRPGVIFGSDGLEGCIHGFFEILSNSTDEAKAGYGNRIEVTRYADNSIQVKDFGRGVPLDYNKSEERYNWELVYNELYAGGKYNDGLYDYSLGLGACATQYASKWFTVTSVRDGYEYSMQFKEGNPDGELIKKKAKGKQTGTTQKWLPDIDVFTDIAIPLEVFQKILKEQAIVNAGITFFLHDEESNTDEEYCYNEGTLGYIKELTENTDTLTEPCIFEGNGTGKTGLINPNMPLRHPWLSVSAIMFSRFDIFIIPQIWNMAGLLTKRPERHLHTHSTNTQKSRKSIPKVKPKSVSTILQTV